MTDGTPTAELGSLVNRHVFISYVHEDTTEVDRLQRALEAARVPVWRDTDALWPGDDWKQRIRAAITEESLVFLACFSDASITKAKSYQNEELLLAVDEFRLRPPGGSWLIPVRFSDCSLPHHDLGAGRTLDSIQRVDLFDDRWDTGIARLTAAVLHAFADLDRSAGREPSGGAGSRSAAAGPVVGTPNPASPTEFVKSALLDPTLQIALDDFVMEQANAAASALSDRSQFPLDGGELTGDLAGTRYLAQQVDRYWSVLEPFLESLVTGCAWSKEDHLELWSRASARVVNASRERAGAVVLLNLQRFPVLQILYAAALAAVHRRNWSALKAVGVDATFVDREGDRIPLVSAAHPWRPFENSELLANLIALEADGTHVDDETLEGLLSGRVGKRHTPVSDHLHARLRPLFVDLIPDDEDFVDTFDRVEVLLGALATDAQEQARLTGGYRDGPWFGSFTWRYRFREKGIEQLLLDEARGEGRNWGPLPAGLFGGDTARAVSSLERFAEEAARARGRRF